MIKAKGWSSVGRNVPSSEAFLDERVLVGLGRWVARVDQEARGEAVGCKPAVVLWNLCRVADCMGIAEIMEVTLCDVRSNGE